MDANDVPRLQQIRQATDSYRLKFQRKLHVTNNLIARLGLDAELEGHTGCVNCLEWNEKGDLLASGSDDLHIVLWDPFSRKRLRTVQSGHNGNIFSVKFLPASNDGVIASGAADCKIRVHDVHMGETSMACSCHGGRVKRLAVAPNIPFMFWSAAEDGIVMQYDLRVPHQCSSVCNNVLINLVNHLGRNAEAKCVAINPLRPHLLAVGANDPYVRLYDRRMLSPTTIKYPTDHTPRPPWERQTNFSAGPVEGGEDNLPPGCVTYYVAGHLPLKQTDYKKRYRTLTSTYLAFSPDGSELLANLGGEQIYLFNILNRRKHQTFDLANFPVTKNNISPKNGSIEHCFHTNGFIPHKNGTTNGVTTNGVTSSLLNDISTTKTVSLQQESEKKVNSKLLPPKVEKLKKKANDHFEKQQYTVAISLYNKGISICPYGAYLYGNRAAAFMKRSWDGDFYAAVRDCHTALKLDPDYLKAHFRLARCLFELHWTKEALECLQAFKTKYPQYTATHAFEALEKDIKSAVYAESEAEEAAANSNNNNNNNNNSSSSSSRNFSESNGPCRGSSSSPRHTKPVISEQEKIWRSTAYDYEARFCGHCNTTTDIKEANFFGSDGQYIVAGSDDGSFFMWDRVTTNIVRVLRGDDSIVNCLQPHPSTCLLATSGIDPVVRLWTPKPEDGSKEDREILDSEDAAVANQKRMNADPLEVMLMNMGYHIPGVLDEEIDSEGSEPNIVQCRPS